jgi:hypothetical protein
VDLGVGGNEEYIIEGQAFTEEAIGHGVGDAGLGPWYAPVGGKSFNRAHGQAPAPGCESPADSAACVRMLEPAGEVFLRFLASVFP